MQPLLYSEIYYPAIFVAIPTLFLCTVKSAQDRLSFALAALLGLVYLIGMYRTDGVDIANYLAFYNGKDQAVFDVGFSTLIFISNKLGLEFRSFLLIIGLVNLLLLARICKHFDSKFGIVLAIYLLHIAIVRDFSQFRVGFAINLVLFGYIKKDMSRYGWYLIGATMHFTATVLIGLFISYAFYNKFQNTRLVKLLPFLGLLVVGSSIQYLAFVDPRIEIYLNWKRPDYGDSVQSYNQLIFVCLLVLIASYINKLRHDIFLYSFVFALFVSISFLSVAIFSFRLTNVALSLYPFFFAQLLNQTDRFHSKLIFITLIVAVLSLRGSTGRVINSIELGVI